MENILEEFEEKDEEKIDKVFYSVIGMSVITIIIMLAVAFATGKAHIDF